MTKNDLETKRLLDKEVLSRNSFDELSFEKPDPLLIARKYKDEYVVLLCALFAYGKADLIVKFLNSLDFTFLDKEDALIEKELSSVYYRFQNSKDIVKIFQTFSKMKRDKISLNEVFAQTYKKENCIFEALDSLIKKIYEYSNDYNSQGFKFFLSSPLKRNKDGKIKLIGNPPYKRWFMFLRWVVRYDNLDVGLWSGVDRKDLILPLDTHTFKVSQKLNLLNRKTYDLKSAVLITQKLKEFDKEDPIKYDFSLYRIGQEKILSKL